MNNNRFVYRLPAEWEPQWGIMLTWPHEKTDWLPYMKEITETFTAMARCIAERENLLIAVPRAEIVPEEIRTLERVHIVECPTDDTWARDHGPITLVRDTRCEVRGTGVRENLLFLDFRFNGWGEKFPSENDNRITSFVARHLSTVAEDSPLGSPLSIEDHDDFVLEGGSIESDGQGTVFTTSQCLLAPNRNQPLSRDEIEKQLKQRLNAERVVWLDNGNLIGDDTDGHIDTIVRCAPNDTLLYVQSRDANDPQHEDFMALEKQLQALVTTEGKPFRLLPLPMPRPIYEGVQSSIFNLQSSIFNDQQRLPATYANFVVLNGAVLVPTYSQEDLDREAKATIGEAFPDREIIGIDARTVIRQHGSLHCLTMQLPEVRRRK